MAVVGLGQLSFRQGSEETRAVCAGHMCSEVSTGDRRACARSPPPWQFPLVWSAQQTCPGKSKDKRRAGASSPTRTVSSASGLRAAPTSSPIL